jgi:hypothetical protein
MSTLTQERRDEIVRTAHRQRNAALWASIVRLFTVVKAQPKLRESRWLAAHRGW